MSYYGMGPNESYRDKCRASSHGLYHAKVTDLHEDYIHPQENGSHNDCDYVLISNNQFGLVAVSDSSWRTVAIIYAIIGLVVNTISVFSVKELPEEELKEDTSERPEQDEKYNLIQAAKLLFSNKYYLMISSVYILQQIYGAMISMGLYVGILCRRKLVLELF